MVADALLGPQDAAVELRFESSLPLTRSAPFDPAREICERAKQAGAWVHVDGAFGLWAAASPRYRHLTEGFDLADSWATDGHKWPNVGYDCGIAIVRNAAAMRAAMASARSA